jgi:hypothetical protein
MKALPRQPMAALSTIQLSENAAAVTWVIDKCQQMQGFWNAAKFAQGSRQQGSLRIEAMRSQAVPSAIINWMIQAPESRLPDISRPRKGCVVGNPALQPTCSTRLSASTRSIFIR